jgi:hypothetical protein
VSPAYAFQVLDETTPRALFVRNNLWVGPAAPQSGRVVNWDQPVDPETDSFDYDGFFPDGQFHMGSGKDGANYASFAAMAAGGRYEAHGRVVGAGLFADGLTAPASYTAHVTPGDGALATGSDALDRGVVLANVTDGFTGSAPDLGANERGCAAPIYGVRPDGTDETNEPTGCDRGNWAGGDGGATGADGGAAGAMDGGGGDGAAAGTDGAAGDAPETGGGCGCRALGDAAPGRGAALFAAVGLAAMGWRRRRR